MKANSWSEKFLESGGLVHLLNTLLSIPSDQVKSGTQKCFALLLKIINYLILEENLTFKSNFQTDSLDMVKLCEKLLFLTLVCGKSISSLGKNSDLNQNNQHDCCELVNYALHLLTVILLSNEASLNHFYQFPSLKDWLRGLILSTPEAQIRRSIVQFIEKLSLEIEKKESSTTQHPSTFFLSLLLSFLEQVEDQDSNTTQCEQYFFITKKLLQSADKSVLLESNSENENFHWNQMIKKLFYLITCHKVRELNSSSGKIICLSFS